MKGIINVDLFFKLVFWQKMSLPLPPSKTQSRLSRRCVQGPALCLNLCQCVGMSHRRRERATGAFLFAFSFFLLRKENTFCTVEISACSLLISSLQVRVEFSDFCSPPGPGMIGKWAFRTPVARPQVPFSALSPVFSTQAIFLQPQTAFFPSRRSLA